MAYLRASTLAALFLFQSNLFVPALSQPPTPAPDVNGDGVVDQEDLIVIQQYWQTGEKYTPTNTATATLTPTVTQSPTITATPTATPTLATFTLHLPNNEPMEFKEIPDK